MYLCKYVLIYVRVCVCACVCVCVCACVCVCICVIVVCCVLCIFECMVVSIFVIPHKYLRKFPKRGGFLLLGCYLSVWHCYSGIQYCNSYFLQPLNKTFKST